MKHREGFGGGGYITRPQRFPGTAEERAANFAQHHFVGTPGNERCFKCDVRPSYISAEWPCGTLVPRETVTYEGVDQR